MGNIPSPPSNVLRRLGFGLGSPDHESDSPTTTLPGLALNLGGVVVGVRVVVRVGFLIKRPEFESQAAQNILGQ